MRLITWNCCRGDMSSKLDALRRFAPDVVVLQEAKPQARELGGQFLEFVPGIGVATFRCDGGEMTRVRASANKCGLTVTLDGPRGSIDIVNIWAHPLKRYADAVLDVVRASPRKRTAIFAGDFNVDATSRGYKALIAELDARNVRSAYHHFHNVAHGAEAHATHYFLRKESRPFHVDFCFAPQSLAVRSVEVGSYAEWGHLSDHVPVVVDLDES